MFIGNPEELETNIIYLDDGRIVASIRLSAGSERLKTFTGDEAEYEAELWIENFKSSLK